MPIDPRAWNSVPCSSNGCVSASSTRSATRVAAASSLGGIEVGEQHQELVAALTRHQVGLPRARAQTVGELGQQQVAGVVAERVVHELEVVEVEEDHRDGGAVALGTLHREDERLLEQLAVRERRSVRRGRPGARCAPRPPSAR